MKMSNRMMLIFLALGLLSFSCQRDFGTAPVRSSAREMTALEKQLGQAGNAFGWHLLNALQQTDANQTLFVSPLSISTALAMTLNGARGETEAAMKAALSLTGLSRDEINANYQSLIRLLTGADSRVTLEIANSIWHRQNFSVLPDFIEANQTYYDAAVRPLDFDAPGAVDIINGWVEDETHGRIEDLIDSIDPMAVMYLINALYFKGDWQYRFKESDTRDDWFTREDDTRLPCRMMSQTATVPCYLGDRADLVDLPYGEGIFSMTVVLPKPGERLENLISSVTDDEWNSWIGNLSQREISVSLPKFTLEYKRDLKDILTALGMGVAFSDSADFSGINAETALAISRVIHQTFVQVDEEGSEAAAATAVEMVYTSLPLAFRADRPFLFVIRESRSNTILFMGKVMEI